MTDNKMRPLMLDDLLPLDEYAARRREFFDSLNRYLDRYRKVRLGPRLILLFENRQTLWFRVQEVLRIARLADPQRVQQELDLYNRLLPGRDQLQGALVIDIEEARFSEELAFWQTLRGDSLLLCVGNRKLPAHLVTCRPEDRTIGTAHWVQFTLQPSDRSAFADFHHPAYIEITHDSYRHESPILGEDVRQSLLDDLVSSDKD
jgi:hypothetical protein